MALQKKKQLKSIHRGGKRKGAGRKSHFSEPTKTVGFRCPISKTEELKKHVNAKLSEWSVSQGGI